MKNLKLLTLLLLLIHSLTIFGQSKKVGIMENMNTTRLQQSGVQTFDNRSYDLGGSFLLFDNWKNGIVFFEDNTAPIDVESLNYNINTRQFILRSAGQDYGLFLQDAKELLVADLSKIGEYTKRKFRKIISEDQRLELGEIIEDNENATLYKVVTYKIAKSNYQPALDQGSVNDRVIKSEVYYIGIDGEFLLLPKNRKKAMKKFSGQKQLSKYLQTHKIDMKSEEDLIALINYLK